MSMSFPNNQETSIDDLLCECADHGNFLSLTCRFITLIILNLHGVNGSANCGWCRYWACVLGGIATMMTLLFEQLVM